MEIGEHGTGDISVRAFLTGELGNASRNTLKTRPPHVDRKEIEEIASLVTQNGELILKSKKIASVPKAFQVHPFSQILILDVRGNLLQDIEGSIFNNLPNISKLDARNNKIR